MLFGFKNMNKCNQSFFREYKKAVFVIYMNKKGQKPGILVQKRLLIVKNVNAKTKKLITLCKLKPNSMLHTEVTNSALEWKNFVAKKVHYFVSDFFCFQTIDDWVQRRGENQC